MPSVDFQMVAFGKKWHRTSDGVPNSHETVLGLWQHYDQHNDMMHPVVALCEFAGWDAADEDDEYGWTMITGYKQKSYGMRVGKDCPPPTFWCDVFYPELGSTEVAYESVLESHDG